MRRLSPLLAAAIAGCATTSAADRQVAQARLDLTAPICSAPRECEAAWAAARNWVIGHCGMKIQTMTDGFIETYNSTDMSLACRVSRDPRPAGGYLFRVAVSCGNIFGCQTPPMRAAQDFNDSVNAATQPFRGAQ